MSEPGRKTLLLVEDEAIIALDEARRLEKFGYTVVTAHSGEAAVEAVLGGDPAPAPGRGMASPIDLVLMDIDLGRGMDGREAAQKILQHRAIPIVFLTSHAEEEMVARVRDITRYGYVLKNAGDFVLRSSIEMAFELFGAHEELRLSEARYRSFFDDSPIAVWEQDLSEAKRRIDEIRTSGIADMRAHLRANPDLVRELTASIRVTDVNRTALQVYEATDKAELMAGLATVFEESTFDSMVEEFVALAHGNVALSLEKVHVTRGGRRINVQINWSVPPGHRARYDRVLVSIADVTELRRSEANLSVTLDSIADGVIVTDADGRVQRMNPAAEELTGWKAVDAVGRPLAECFVIIDSRTRSPMPDPVEHVLSTGETVELGNHTSLIRPDGDERQIADAASPIQTRERTLLGAVLVFRDVTSAYEQREALRRSERQLARAQRLAAVGSWEFDLTTNRASGSVEARRIYGIGDEELTIETAQKVPLPEYRTIMDKALRDLVTKGHPYDVEFQIRRVSDGAIRDIHGLAEYDSANNLVTGVIRDVTDEKAVERELRQESKRLRTLLQYGDLAWWEFHLEDGSVVFSDEKATMLGYRPEDFHTYTDFTALLHDDDYEPTMQAMKDHLAGRVNAYDCAYRIRAADGTYRWIHDTGAVTARNLDGSPRTLTGLVRDIDRQRRTEEEARRSEDWFRKVVENANDIVYTLDLGGVFTYVSPAWTPILGHGPDDVVGRSFDDFVHPDDVAACRRFLETVTREGVARAGVEYRVFHADGGTRVHSSNAAPLWGDDGAVSGYLGIARDITDAVQARMRIDALLEEKDLLLREVHHRVKNNLTTVAGLLALQAETVSTEETAQALVEAQGRVQAMLQIYQTLFQSTSYREIPLAMFLKTLVESVAATQGARAEGVELQMELDDIVASPDVSVPIGIIVNELLSNCYKYAFPKGRSGTVRVVARRLDGEIELTVQDDGIGLPEGVTLERSVGFGLQLVWAEARQLNATVTFTSTEGTGITLRIPHPHQE